MVYEFKKSVGFSLNRLGVLVRRRLLQALRPWELTPEQWQVLSVSVANRTGVSAKEICEITGLDRHSVSKLLEKLESREWLRREPHEEDGRSMVIFPAQKLITAYPSMKQSLKSEFAPVWLSLGEDEAELRRLCSKLLEIME